MSNRIAQLITDKKEHLEQIKQSLRPDLRYSSLGPTPDEIAEALPFLIEKIESGIVDKQIMDGINQYSNLLYLVLGLPLQQAVPYLTSDPHFLPDNISIPNTHRETDPSALFSVLQKMTRIQRNRLLEAFPDANTTDYLLLQQALVEPNIEALKIVLEKESIDISEIQKAFGLLLDAQEFTEIIKPDLASDDVTLDVFFQFCEELFPLIASDLYESELYVESVDLMRKKQGNDHIAPETLNKWVTNLTALRLKSYWYCRDSYCDKEAKIIDDYINNPYFEPFVSKCRAEFEEEERIREEESNGGEIVDVDTEPVVDEEHEQAPQSAYIDDKEKIFTFAPNVNAVNLFPESEYAFNGSKGLAEYAINNKEKIECFVHLLANKFHYIPKDKKHARAFVRTITGIKCDGGIIKPILQSREAVEAILYMAQQHILPGNLKDALQKFDIKEGVDIKPMKINPSSYAGRADNEFIKLAADVFSDYCRQKQTKQYEDCAFLIL